LDSRDLFSLILSLTHSHPTIKDVWIIPPLTHAPARALTYPTTLSLSHSLSLALFSIVDPDGGGQGGEGWEVALHRGCTRTITRRAPPLAGGRGSGCALALHSHVEAYAMVVPVAAWEFCGPRRVALALQCGSGVAMPRELYGPRQWHWVAKWEQTS
jgi:hypothetical protein